MNDNDRKGFWGFFMLIGFVVLALVIGHTVGSLSANNRDLEMAKMGYCEQPISPGSNCTYWAPCKEIK